MTIWVDDMYLSPIGQFGRIKMSHMVADTSEELRAFATQLGLRQSWIQFKGTRYEHFDISISVRTKAVALGAKEITMRELARMCKERNYK